MSEPSSAIIERIADLLPSGRRNRYICPVCQGDSLVVTPSRGLVKCQTSSCTPEAIWRKLSSSSKPVKAEKVADNAPTLLHDDTIAGVKERSDIVQVIGATVELKKSGHGFMGLCPFHTEKTPSFHVSPDRQNYHCFGCGAGGDAISFVQQTQHLSFVDTVLSLAKQFNVEVKTQRPEQTAEFRRKLTHHEELKDLLAVASRWFQRKLRESGGKGAHEYLLQRKLSQDAIADWGLGYAPDSYDELHRYLSQDYSDELQLQAGLIAKRKSGDGYIDLFRDRVIIPMHDLQGRVIAFAGRALGDVQPKYLNSPETELFSKSNYLFGLNRAKKAIHEADQALLMEGHFDVITAHELGVNYAIAAMGTAISEQQISQAVRFSASKTLILSLDSDTAGRNATQRVFQVAQPLIQAEAIQIKVLSLPTKDADEFFQSHPPSAFDVLLQNALFWVDWQLVQIFDDKDLDRGEVFQQVTSAVSELMALIHNPATRSYYLRRAAQWLARNDPDQALQFEVDLRSQFDQKTLEQSAVTPERLLDYESQLRQIQAIEADIERDLRLVEFSKAQHVPMAIVRKHMHQVSDYGAEARIKTSDSIAGDLMTDIEQRSAGEKVTGYKVNLIDFDQLLGGLRAGELIILGARPSMGKTAFALQVAEEIAINYGSVIFFSMEMSANALLERRVCARTGIDGQQLLQGHISQKETDAVFAAIGELGQLPITVDESSSLSISEVIARCRRIHAENPTKLIVLDYLQLMISDDGDNVRHELHEITKRFKILGRELDCPVLLLSQVNRDLANRSNKRPQMHDLKESGAIEQNADVIILMHRDEVYNPETSDRGICELIVAKHRNGPIGTAKVLYEPQFSRFKNLVTPNSSPYAY